MTNYPSQLDTDVELPRVENNISEIGEEAINATRSAIFSIEEEVGIGGKGSLTSIADRIAISINPDGSIKPSVLTAIGLVTLPITNYHISSTAEISESKLSLTYSTAYLYTIYIGLINSIDVLNGFYTLIGIQVAPHIAGTDYNHYLFHIHVDTPTIFLKTDPSVGVTSSGTSVVNRDTSNLQNLVQDISDNLVVHEKSNGESGVTVSTGGTVPPSYFAHNASGLYVNPSNFSSIPKSNQDVQSVIDFMDTSSLALLGGRTTNLFSNGISRHSRSTTLLLNGYGSLLVPPTPITAYLLNNPPGPTSITPIDDIVNGDDVIIFAPTAAQLTGYLFDSQFSLVRPGDLITINYSNSSVAYQFTIESVKAIAGSPSTYAVRINGRNKAGSSSGYAQINKSLFNRSKYNVLANIRAPNTFGAYESLIVASPRGATTLGINFNPSQLSANHYYLYLTLLQNGDLTSIHHLPAIDVTGNLGITPGSYTLQSIIDATNTAFRTYGYNYRFIAFDYDGQFGIALGDHYNDSGFSIISGTVNASGNYTSSSITGFPKNVVDNFLGIDPLGLGSLGSNSASPPASVTYANATTALNKPTIVFKPLKKNFYYLNGVEKDSLYSDPLNLVSEIDQYGDGYFPATILPSPTTQIYSDRVETVYSVTKDVSNSALEIGKTIVVQPAFPTTDVRFNLNDYGRFTIKSVNYFNCGELDGYAYITVKDSVHGTGVSPSSISTSIPVNLYFTDDSVTFNAENIADETVTTPYKRFFENYIDNTGHTFTHERARFLIASDQISKINMNYVSPKLAGYATSNNFKQIRLSITSYVVNTGIFSGRLSKYDSATVTYSNYGPTTAGKKGEITRFYDETGIDYIDFIFELSDSSITAISSTEVLDIQLFGSLALNQEEMLLSTCQINDSTKKISYLNDKREFGNISEEHLTNSALNWITSVSKLILKNRVISGFDITQTGYGISVDVAVNGNSTLKLPGGSALINGRIVNVNNSVTTIPLIQEYVTTPTYYPIINWLVCANSKGQIELIAETIDRGAGLSDSRIYYVRNTNLSSPVSYAIRAESAARLSSATTNDFRDIILLYRIIATVTPTGIGSTVMSTITNSADLRVSLTRI